MVPHYVNSVTLIRRTCITNTMQINETRAKVSTYYSCLPSLCMFYKRTKPSEAAFSLASFICLFALLIHFSFDERISLKLTGERSMWECCDFRPLVHRTLCMLWCLECRSVNERKWVLWKRDVPPWEESERNSENTASVCWTSTKKISSSKIQCQSQAPQFCCACTHKFTYNMTAGAAIEHDYTRVQR